MIFILIAYILLLIFFIIFLLLGLIVVLHYLIGELDHFQTVIYKTGLNSIMVWKSNQDARLDVRDRASLINDTGDVRDYALTVAKDTHNQDVIERRVKRLVWRVIARDALRADSLKKG